MTPYRTLHGIAQTLPELTAREEIEAALDKLEYLFEVIPPEMQEYAAPGSIQGAIGMVLIGTALAVKQ